MSAHTIARLLGMESEMKLRLHGNSIRLRLNRNDVAVFAKSGRIEEALDFGGGVRLTYMLEVSQKLNGPRAFFQGGAIRIEVPVEDAQDWANTNRVGISAQDRRISISVEKDFQCLHDPDPDAYPNPEGQCDVAPGTVAS